MEHIRLICFSDKCIILNPEDKATQNFIFGLKMQFRCEVGQDGCWFQTGAQDGQQCHDDSRVKADTSMRLLYQKSVQVSTDIKFSFLK